MATNIGLFRNKSKSDLNYYKSRLEHKLYLARENPEPIFDLSECNLKLIPSGVFSLCKIFLKEQLLLQVNQISSLSGGGSLSDLSLISVLDLHENRFSSLPKEIGSLVNLLELNVSHNELKTLPEETACLVRLRVLDCSHNRLSHLPSGLSKLNALTLLDLRHNSRLTSLPPGLDRPLLALKHDEHLQHTLKNIINTCEVCVNDSIPNIAPGPESSLNPAAFVTHDSFKLLERKKEQKLRELLDVEKNLQEQKLKEFQLHESIKKDKTELLSSIKQQQRKIEEDVSRLQIKKELEKEKMLTHLLQVERQADETIGDLLALNRALHESSHWQQPELGPITDWGTGAGTGPLRRQQIIENMETLLAEECRHREKLIKDEKNQAESMENILLSEVMRARGVQQEALVAAVETDERVQRALVATLLERADARARTLVAQVALVEQQLAALTVLELKRKEAQCHQHLNELAEKRKVLSELLVDLIQEQKERQRQLLESLPPLQRHSQVTSYFKEPDFWMHEYQRLLEVHPAAVSPSPLHTGLVHQLVVGGVAHCLPLLTHGPLEHITHASLLQAGVASEEEREAVLRAVTVHLTRTQAELSPTAPPLDEPSAPPLSPSLVRPSLPECVVCMESQCAVVFVPCGHLCVCFACSSCLQLCPLCRAPLQRKIIVIIP